MYTFNANQPENRDVLRNGVSGLQWYSRQDFYLQILSVAWSVFKSYDDENILHSGKNLPSQISELSILSRYLFIIFLLGSEYICLGVLILSVYDQMSIPCINTTLLEGQMQIFSPDQTV